MVPAVISAFLSKNDGEKLEKTLQTRASATNKGERKKYRTYHLCSYECFTCECIPICIHVSVRMCLCVYVYRCVNMRIDLDVVLINS